MSYFCKYCNYLTDDSGNFSHHKKSKKHLKNLDIIALNKSNKKINDSKILKNTGTVDDTGTNKIYSCELCSKNYQTRSGLFKHKKICDNNSLPKNKKISIKELQLKLEFSEREKELFKKFEKEKTDLLNNFMANANTIINKTSDNSKLATQAIQNVSMSALKYANEKFKDTPALLPLENFNINDLNFDNVENKKQLIEILIYNAKQKSLDKLLGDHIVKNYKKDNPAEQSFHATDCSRLNYIVRELIENALTWSMDKNGIKICKDIVKPLIKKCIDALLDHQRILLQEMGNGNLNKQKDVELIIDVIMSIDSGSLESDINKYIAPHFNLNKKDN